jgi:hypothetical protein
LGISSPRFSGLMMVFTYLFKWFADFHRIQGSNVLGAYHTCAESKILQSVSMTEWLSLRWEEKHQYDNSGIAKHVLLDLRPSPLYIIWLDSMHYLDGVYEQMKPIDYRERESRR